MTNIEFVPFCPVWLQPWAIPPKILAKNGLPYLCHCGIVHQLFVACYCATSDRMYHGVCVMLEIH